MSADDGRAALPDRWLDDIVELPKALEDRAMAALRNKVSAGLRRAARGVASPSSAATLARASRLLLRRELRARFATYGPAFIDAVSARGVFTPAAAEVRLDAAFVQDALRSLDVEAVVAAVKSAVLASEGPMPIDGVCDLAVALASPQSAPRSSTVNDAASVDGPTVTDAIERPEPALLPLRTEAHAEPSRVSSAGDADDEGKVSDVGSESTSCSDGPESDSATLGEELLMEAEAQMEAHGVMSLDSAQLSAIIAAQRDAHAEAAQAWLDDDERGHRSAADDESFDGAAGAATGGEVDGGRTHGTIYSLSAKEFPNAVPSRPARPPRLLNLPLRPGVTGSASQRVPLDVADPELASSGGSTPLPYDASGLPEPNIPEDQWFGPRLGGPARPHQFERHVDKRHRYLRPTGPHRTVDSVRSAVAASSTYDGAGSPRDSEVESRRSDSGESQRAASHVAKAGDAAEVEAVRESTPDVSGAQPAGTLRLKPGTSHSQSFYAVDSCVDEDYPVPPDVLRGIQQRSRDRIAARTQPREKAADAASFQVPIQLPSKRVEAWRTDDTLELLPPSLPDVDPVSMAAEDLPNFDPVVPSLFGSATADAPVAYTEEELAELVPRLYADVDAALCYVVDKSKRVNSMADDILGPGPELPSTASEPGMPPRDSHALIEAAREAEFGDEDTVDYGGSAALFMQQNLHESMHEPLRDGWGAELPDVAAAVVDESAERPPPAAVPDQPVVPIPNACWALGEQVTLHPVSLETEDTLGTLRMLLRRVCAPQLDTDTAMTRITVHALDQCLGGVGSDLLPPEPTEAGDALVHAALGTPVDLMLDSVGVAGEPGDPGEMDPFDPSIFVPQSDVRSIVPSALTEALRRVLELLKVPPLARIDAMLRYTAFADSATVSATGRRDIAPACPDGKRHMVVQTAGVAAKRLRRVLPAWRSAAGAVTDREAVLEQLRAAVAEAADRGFPDSALIQLKRLVIASEWCRRCCRRLWDEGKEVVSRSECCCVFRDHPATLTTTTRS